MPFEIIRADITAMHTDAIVNAANSSLKCGGGVCGAIFTAAGRAEMKKACRELRHCDVGGAVVTGGFALPAKYVIHAVGPIWRGGESGERELLRRCYFSALRAAEQKGCESAAFPLISSGSYGFPKIAALKIALDAISEFLLEHEMQVYIVVFDKDAAKLSEKLIGDIQQFIDDNYYEEHRCNARNNARNEDAYFRQLSEQPRAVNAAQVSLEDALGNMSEGFSLALLRLIDERGMTDVQTYKRAGIDRKLFSKIRKGGGYNPSKRTALALAVALRLNEQETADLISKAGYALSNSSKFDVIVAYFIRRGNCDVFEINEALYAFGEQTLS